MTKKKPPKLTPAKARAAARLARDQRRPDDHLTDAGRYAAFLGPVHYDPRRARPETPLLDALAALEEDTDPYVKARRKLADAKLDAGIQHAVVVLNACGVTTFQSCEGQSLRRLLGFVGVREHSYEEPTVEFHGSVAEGHRALAIALEHDLPVVELQRVWQIDRGDMLQPIWRMLFGSWALRDWNLKVDTNGGYGADKES